MNSSSETIQQSNSVVTQSSELRVCIGIDLNFLSDYFKKTDLGKNANNRFDAINFCQHSSSINANKENTDKLPKYNTTLFAGRTYIYEIQKEDISSFKTTICCEDLEMESIILTFLNNDKSLKWENLLDLTQGTFEITDDNSIIITDFIDPTAKNAIKFKIKDEVDENTEEFQQNIEYDILFKYKCSINNNSYETKYAIIDPFISHTTGVDPK